ncbi:Cmx/CmrA family chloramphenicol efflux MFS transporter [Humidisolicoccus flavus]|uniref:Cmx/CmrA family chloramphenicol efflux MFS transporter n=1 Tax=Humidisolicoccus flavus TaxID=3111414 RepID=UPI003252315E
MPLLIVLLALAVFAQGTSEFMLAGLLPDIAADLQISIPQAGLLTSAFAAGMILGAPLMAALSRTWSPRLSLSGFLLIFIAMHVVGALTASYELLLLTRVVAAVTNAGFLAVTLSTVSRLVPADRTARALAVILGGTTLALIAGVPGGAVVGSVLDWRAALWAVAAISVPAFVAVALAAPARPSTAERPSSLGGELRSLRSARLLTMLALAVLINGATFCAFTYLASLATDGAGLAANFVPIVLAVFGVGAFAGVWIAGRFGDAHSTRIVIGGGGALLLGWVVFALCAHDPRAVFVFSFLQGVLSFAVGSTLIAASVRAAHSAPTMSGSFATSALNVGAAIGPMLGGIAFASSAGTQGPLFVSAGLVAGALLVMVSARSLLLRG